jgi:hypothetical protein
MKNVKNLRTVIAIFLCFAFILAFAACAKSDDKKADDKPTSAGDDPGGAVETTQDPDAPDSVSLDMKGKTFTFFTPGWGGDGNLYADVGAETDSDEPIETAAYNRRIKIEEMYNCKIKQVNVGETAEAVTTYRNTILAGDKSYDVGYTMCTNFASLLSGNFLVDWKNLTYVDMEKPYWNKNFYDSMAIMGRHFAADGDISRRRLQCVWIMCFNKAMIAANEFESPYDLVKAGKWTYGKMHEMAKKVARDLNGDGKMLRQDDLWGINYTGDTIMGIINCSGVKIAELNAEGIPEFTLNTEVNLEKLFRIYEEMRDDRYSVDTLFAPGADVGTFADAEIFGQDRCLFLACASHNISQMRAGETTDYGLRAMESDFGIIPYPKWDEAQDKYMPHTAGNYHPVMSIPQTNEDLDATSIILEMMAYEGMKTIKPAFYDSLLKTKTARDEESAEMLDFIFGNLSYDVGNMYNFGGVTGVFGYQMNNNPKMKIVSTIEKNVGKWQKDIDKIIEEIEKNS